MKVILLTDVKNLGKKGSVVNVADGMAMNSLLPQKKAIIATADNMQKLSADVHNKENHAAAQTAAAMKFLEKIPSELVIAQKVNEKGNLFKTIDAVAIAKELAAAVGHTGSIPCKVVPSEPAIKSLGSYPCTLVVHDGVTKKHITRTLSVVIQKA